MIQLKILVGLLIWASCLTIRAAPREPEARQGQIDLKGWNGEGALSLNGEWIFFPNELLSPDTLYERIADGKYRTTQLGRSFAELLGAEHSNSQGFGTYALVLKDIPAEIDLALTRPSAFTSAEVFWVDADQTGQSRSLMKIGKTGKREEDSIPGSVVPVRATILQSIAKDAALVIHVSNFQYTWGGLWNPPRLGSSKYLMKQYDNDRDVNFLTIGILLFICFTNMSLFLQRREDRGTFWLSALSLIYAIRTYTFLDGSLWFIPPTSEFAYNLKLIYSTMCLLPMVGFSFFSIYFPRQFRPRLVRFMTWITLPTAAFIWVTPPLFFGHLGNPLIYACFMALVVMCLLIVKAFINREVGGTICLLGMLGPITGGTIEMLAALGVIKDPLNAMGYGMIVFVVFQSQIVASRFVYAFRQSEHLSRNLQLEVDRQTRDIRSILDNIKQGIFTLINPGKIVGPQYSPFTNTMMECSQLQGRCLEDILLDDSQLNSEQKAQLNSALDSCLGEDSINFEMNESCLPHEIILNRPTKERSQILEIQWSPIIDASNQIEKILVCARDVTEVRQLRVEADNNRRELTILQEIIKVQEDKFARFLTKSQEYIAENYHFLKNSPRGSVQIAKRLFVNLHTMKGTARTFHFKTLSNQTHEAEQYLSDHLKGKQPWDKSRLEADLKAVQDCLQDYQNIARDKLQWNLGKQTVKMTKEDIVSLLPILQSLEGEIESYEGKSQLAILGTCLLENCFSKLNEIISESARGLDSIAKDLDKCLPEITIGPNKYLLVDDWTDRMHSVLTHVLRNSIDHGIESKSQRIASGKRPIGNIFIRLSDDSTYLNIEIQDDGRGLDLEKVKKLGLERNLLQSPLPPPDEIAKLIFHSGFTTKDQVTDISGRGVGMDAVRSFMEEGGGSVRIELEADPIDQHQVAFALHLALPRKAWVEVPSAEKFDIDPLLRSG